MGIYDTKTPAAQTRVHSQKRQLQSERSPYDGLMQMASMVGNSAMEAYLREQQAPQSNTLATESGGQELPPSLRERMEARLGVPLDDVCVHYNSDKPASFMARAFTKGSEIHIAPGQEDTLEHELGHVAQQKAGMVRPTGSINGEAVNEDEGLEGEVDKSNFYSGSLTNSTPSEITQFMRPSGKKGGKKDDRKREKSEPTHGAARALKAGGRGNHYYNDVAGFFRNLLTDMKVEQILANMRCYAQDEDAEISATFSSIVAPIEAIYQQITQQFAVFSGLRDATGHSFNGYDSSSARTGAVATDVNPELMPNDEFFACRFGEVRDSILAAVSFMNQQNFIDAITAFKDAVVCLNVLISDIPYFTTDMALTPEMLGAAIPKKEEIKPEFISWKYEVEASIQHMCELIIALLRMLISFCSVNFRLYQV